MDSPNAARRVILHGTHVGPDAEMDPTCSDDACDHEHPNAYIPELYVLEACPSKPDRQLSHHDAMTSTRVVQSPNRA